MIQGWWIAAGLAWAGLTFGVIVRLRNAKAKPVLLDEPDAPEPFLCCPECQSTDLARISTNVSVRPDGEELESVPTGAQLACRRCPCVFDANTRGTYKPHPLSFGTYAPRPPAEPPANDQAQRGTTRPPVGPAPPLVPRERPRA